MNFAVGGTGVRPRRMPAASPPTRVNLNYVAASSKLAFNRRNLIRGIA
jgi:hypothetical protein